MIESTQAASNKFSSQDIAAFCRESTAAQTYKTINWEITNYKLNSPYCFDKECLSENAAQLDPWLLSEVPDQDIRMQSFTSNLTYYLESPIFSLESAKQLITSGGLQLVYLSNSSGVSVDNLQTLPTADQVGFASKVNIDSIKLFFGLEATCAQLTLPGFQCAADMRKTALRMQPHVLGGKTAFTDIPIYQKILSNPDVYVNGLTKAALKQITRAQSNDLNGADLFDDLESSFKNTGSTEAQADSRTWDVLSIIATGGPNIIGRLAFLTIDPKTQISGSQVRVALSVIAALTPLLDEKSTGSGHIYSYPKSIHSTCDSGKPYHFWLTASIARDLVLNDHSTVSGAAAAAFNIQKGYEMFSKTPGRDPTIPFTNDLFNPYSNTIRADLAYSSAGALFGARAAKGKHTNINVDEGLAKIIQGARPIGKITDPRATKTLSLSLEYLRDWENIFAPNQAYFFYEKNLND